MPSSEDRAPQIDQRAMADPANLSPAVYDQLHRLAERFFRDQPKAITLQPTALVHEAYLKVADQSSFESQAHFMAVAARAMRHILIDRARRRAAERHGGGLQRVSLRETAVGDKPVEDDVDVLALDAALGALAELDERKSRIVELRFFGGMSIEETATALGIARSTVTEDWRVARAWLASELQGDA